MFKWCGIAGMVGLIALASCHAHKEVATTNTTTSSSSKMLDKYAEQMHTSAASLHNAQLYEFIDSWVGVPYKYGGQSKQGTDCSGFVQVVFREVYNKGLERTATAMVKQCKIIKKEELSEGDLVFFDIAGNNSHVGIYLANNYFIHASSSKGVMISDLRSDYYIKYWGRAGRVY